MIERMKEIRRRRKRKEKAKKARKKAAIAAGQEAGAQALNAPSERPTRAAANRTPTRASVSTVDQASHCRRRAASWSVQGTSIRRRVSGRPVISTSYARTSPETASSARARITRPQAGQRRAQASGLRSTAALAAGTSEGHGKV